MKKVTASIFFILSTVAIAAPKGEAVRLKEAGAALIEAGLPVGHVAGKTKTAYGLNIAKAMPAGSACTIDSSIDAQGNISVTIDNRNDVISDLRGAYTYVNIGGSGGELVSLEKVGDSNLVHLVAKQSYPRDRAEDGTNRPQISTSQLIITQDHDVVIPGATGQPTMECKF